MKNFLSCALGYIYMWYVPWSTFYPETITYVKWNPV